MDNIFDVKLSRNAVKDLKKLPAYIITKLYAWIEDVEQIGLSEVRKIPGYHDEPLHGDRYGQRSIRLNRSYRAIYIIENNRQIRFVEIIEVNNHGY